MGGTPPRSSDHPSWPSTGLSERPPKPPAQPSPPPMYAAQQRGGGAGKKFAGPPGHTQSRGSAPHKFCRAPGCGERPPRPATVPATSGLVRPAAEGMTLGNFCAAPPAASGSTTTGGRIPRAPTGGGAWSGPVGAPTPTVEGATASPTPPATVATGRPSPPPQPP